MYVLDLVLLELPKESEVILDNRLSASSPNSPKVEKEKWVNLYPFSSHLAVYFVLFLSSALAREAPGAHEESHVTVKGEPLVTSTHASFP